MWLPPSLSQSVLAPSPSLDVQLNATATIGNGIGNGIGIEGGAVAEPGSGRCSDALRACRRSGRPG